MKYTLIISFCLCFIPCACKRNIPFFGGKLCKVYPGVGDYKSHRAPRPCGGKGGAFPLTAAFPIGCAVSRRGGGSEAVRQQAGLARRFCWPWGGSLVGCRAAWGRGGVENAGRRLAGAGKGVSSVVSVRGMLAEARSGVGALARAGGMIPGKRRGEWSPAAPRRFTPVSSASRNGN